MNTTVKIAALISVLIFGGIIVVFLSLNGGGDKTEQPEESASRSASERAGPDGAPPEDSRDTGAPLTQRPVDPGSVEVSVEVRDKARERLLAAATVRVFRRNDAEMGSSELTDLPRAQRGKVTFHLRPGAYEIRAQCPGYTGDKHSLTLVKGQEPYPVVFRLDHGTSIMGIVLDEARNPLPGARVFAFKEFTDPDADMETILRMLTELQRYTGTIDSETTTGPDGRFQLDGLENFWYTVRATATTFTPGEVFDVRAGNAKPLEIVLRKGALLAGVVADPAGRAVPGATVSAYQELEGGGLFRIIRSKAQPPIEETTTGADGRYELKSLGAGLYNFLVSAPAFQEHREMKHRIVSGENAAKNFTLQPGHVIEGYVRGPDDEPVVGARVKANPTGVQTAAPRDQIRIEVAEDGILTDAQGYFRFDTLGDAKHMLLVFHDDYESLQKKDVRPDEEPLTLRLGFGGRLYGTIVDAATAQPIAGASVSATDVAALRKSATSGPDGSYDLRGLGGNRRPIQVYVQADGYARDKRQVNVQAGREYEENFELHQSGIVQGVVVNTSGKPLNGAHVEVRPTEDSTATLRVLGNGTSDTDGRFAILDVEPGEALQVRVKLQTYLETFSGVFSLASGERKEIGEIVLSLGGEIEGVVVDAENRPVNGVWIEARPEGGTELTPGTSVQSEGGGRFLCRGLRGGLYSLIAKANGYIDTTQANVEVREGQKNTGVKIVLERGGVLEGVVISAASGEPVQGAEVLARDYGEGIQERRGVSDGKGRFQFNNIVAKDAVELEVTHQDYSTFNDKSVPVGKTDYQVVLKALGSIVGRVLDPLGQPMDSFTVQPQPRDTSERADASRLRSKSFNPADGRFEYRGVPDGVYSLAVRSVRYSAVTLEEIEVTAGKVVDIGDIQLAEGGTVTGSVIDGSNGRPVGGARVRVVQGARVFEPGKSSPVTTSGPDGRFTIDGLKDQVISLEVSHDDYATQRVTGIDPRVGPKSRNLVVELEAAGELGGAVINGSGQPIKGMPIYLVAKDEGGRSDTASTDTEGGFLFRKVAPGAYTVRAHRGFGKPGAEQEVQVFSGERTEVELRVDER